jgi:acyl-CoA reductase-like NAD-dependent aldehyde dehydrogenase
MSGATFPSVNPATAARWALVSDGSVSDVAAAVTAARRGFLSDEWRKLSATRRGRILMRLAELIQDNAEHIATIEALDNGKLYKETFAQLKMVPDWLYYFGGLADKVEGAVIPLDRQSVLNYTLREPLGVVGIITPWNSPVLMAMMVIAPALAAGNAVVVKPSEFTSASIIEVARLTEKAGFPPGIFNVVTGGRRVGEALASHPGVGMLSFTGGTETGRRVAESVAGRIGRYNLELGGKSPNIVFADADLAAAEAGIIAGIYGASGQTCVAGSRALIEAPIFEQLVDRLVERATRIRLGDPMDPETEMGPIATQEHLGRIETFVEDARREGAVVLAGGSRARVDSLPEGFFYLPTILEARNNSAVAQEEIFGPVLVVMPFNTESEVVELANGTRYGLAAGIWTSSIKRAHRLSGLLQAGTVWINMYRAVTFNSPHGGYKDSGVGRVNGMEAIYEYMQTKSVWCELADEI